VDNGKIRWIDLDLPDVIDLRRKYITESSRRQFISKSVFDKSWYDEIKDKDRLMFIIAGVLYYFCENEIKGLFSDFYKIFKQGGVEIVFDYCSNRGLKISNKRVIEKGGFDKSAGLKWGIDDIYRLEKWPLSHIKILEDMPMFREYKQNFPFYKRMGMNIIDSLKIMSLAHIKIG
jgi:O-methyltransferase involved in polyketide biosynthesis